MQVTHNGPTLDQSDDQIATPAPSSAYPLENGQDQLVLALDLRRVDPSNPDGTSVPDLAFLLAGQDPAKAQALSFLVDSIAELLGFDPSLSRVGFTKVVDFEPGTGSATLDEFREVASQLTSFPAAEEVQTEQPIELPTNTPEDTGATVAVDSAGVAVVLDDAVYPSDPEYMPGPDVTVLDAPAPRVVEDIPHDLGPDKDWAEGFTLADQHPIIDVDGIEMDIDVDGIEG